jgi:MFS family permease
MVVYLAHLVTATTTTFNITLTPTLDDLPGGSTLQGLANGLASWALIAALVGLVIGAAAWALGVHSQNYQQSMVGRRAVLVSGLAALLVGAAPLIVTFFFDAGTSAH